MSDAHLLRIETQLRALELEAEFQRTTLAADLSQWEKRHPLAWLGTAAKVAGEVAGDLLTHRSVRLLLVGAGLRLLRGWLKG